MHAIPPGIVTLTDAARHLDLSTRQLHAVAASTPLRSLHTVALGRALGTYRLIPQLGVILLRQLCTAHPWYTPAWQTAIRALLASASWQAALEAVRELAAAQERPRSAWRYTGSPDAAAGKRPGRGAVEALLTAAPLVPTLEALHEESLALLAHEHLQDQLEVEQMIVDRLLDAERAVILVGTDETAYVLPRQLLRRVSLDEEKALGTLIATHTSAGIVLDVWPALETAAERAWWDNPEALREHLIEVGA